MNVSPNFTLAEFTVSTKASKLGIYNQPDALTLENIKYTASKLELIRKLTNKPIVISSGYRSPVLNKAVKGARDSQHVLGQAVDINCPAFGNCTELFKAIYNSGIPYDQLILEYAPHGWVHVSFRENPRHQALVINESGTTVYKP